MNEDKEVILSKHIAISSFTCHEIDRPRRTLDFEVISSRLFGASKQKKTSNRGYRYMLHGSTDFCSFVSPIDQLGIENTGNQIGNNHSKQEEHMLDLYPSIKLIGTEIQTQGEQIRPSSCVSLYDSIPWSVRKLEKKAK